MRTDGRAVRILAVDDEASVRDWLRFLFEREGWLVDEAACGEAALAWLAANDVDIVVLDQMMGDGLTGLDTAKKLRKLHYDGAIVLFSAFLEPALEKRLRRLKVLPVSKVDQTGLLRVLHA